MGPQLGSLLQQTQSLLHSFRRTSLYLFIYQFNHQSYLGCSFKNLIAFCCAMIKNNLVSLLESSSPLYYPILTPLVSFISLCASFEAGLIHSLGTSTLTDIDHVSIMKSRVSPTTKKGGITGQNDPKHASIHRNYTPPYPYISSIRSKTRRCKDPYPAMPDSLIS